MRGGACRARGAWGEDVVAEDLRRRGWTILARNFRCRFGELDIVAENGEILAFVEVKLRKDDHFAPARAFVTAEKQRKLRLAAQTYLQQNACALQPRFDVAEVYAPAGARAAAPTIQYIENAF